MELDVNNDLVEPLLELADRFSCMIEMATYLAMMMVGGPKRFFLCYCDDAWQVAGDKRIPGKFQASFAQCDDDLELALFLMKVWQQYGSSSQRPNKWTEDWKINHQELIYSVEQKRDQLLASHFYKKSDDEYVRPVDLLLISKVRLLMAYHLISIERDHAGQQKKGLAIRGGIYHGSKERQAVSIHADSVCHRRKMDMHPFLYFFPDQDKRANGIEAQQVVYIPPDWLAWLEEEERDEFDLAKFLVEKTRDTRSIDVRLPKRPERPGRTERSDRTSEFLGQNLSALFQSFTSIDYGSDEVSVEEYYGPGAPLGDKASSDNALAGFLADPDEKGRKEYQGTVMKIFASPRNYALVRFKGGLVGVLRSSRIWGRCNDIRDEESIRANQSISVYIDRLDKRRKVADLDARLPELNPLRDFQVGQQLWAIVESIQQHMLVNIHPQLRPALCLNACHASGSDVQQASYNVGEPVLVEITKIVPEELDVEVCIVPTEC